MHQSTYTASGPNEFQQEERKIMNQSEFQQDAQAKIIQPPSATFERTSFDQLLCQYDLSHDLPPTLELTQAFLLTQNMKETAVKVGGLTAGGSGYFLKNDYVGEASRLSDAMQSVSRLLGNLGTSDKASNFLIEQRKLMRAQAKENKRIREFMDCKIVDGMEYIRTKEKIAQTKSRVKDVRAQVKLEFQLLEHQFTSDSEQSLENQQQLNRVASIDNGVEKPQQNGTTTQNNSQTHEDSEEAAKSRLETEKRIKLIIQQLRKDAKENLKIAHKSMNSDEIPITKIVHRLRNDKKYCKKREQKAIDKGFITTLEATISQLKSELEELKVKHQSIASGKQQSELELLIQQYDQFQGIEKRLNIDGIDKSVSEIDCIPLNSKGYQIQNILLDFCGIDTKGQLSFQTKGKRDVFGRIIKLPSKSQQLSQYLDQRDDSTRSNNEGLNNSKKNQEIVKMIGLDPNSLFQNIDKYMVRVDKMPKFSNVFERAEPMLPGMSMTVAGSLLTGNQTGQMTFARVDGRNVISLEFNPYEIQDPQKKKVYEQAMKEIAEQRDKFKSISKQSREKQDVKNIQRAWFNIVKKEIPKAYKYFQRYQADKETNNKKQSQNCLKEVRKKAIKTQRAAKESTFRAKKLTKEMTNFWKKRDKEMADLKRKKEKFEKEMKRKQEEEKESLLQKKRLEFIMQQSEIYAHFMSKKLGLADEQHKQREMDLEDERVENFNRVQIDTNQAKQNVASMISENLNRVGQFDQETINKRHQIRQINEDELEVDKFDNPDASSLSNIVQAPSCFLGKLKDYQLKGMRWLDNLYEQGINGILADEMGLGKTIQAIALLAHLYENKGVWGPFLIIVPVTTLHNWQNELAKFCPALKVLPYFGSPEERKKLGKFLDPKNLYNPNTRINVLLTSYNLIVNNQKDQVKLLRVKWHYMILDEAQAIKNNLSRRWKVLLQFQTRNRLLLTGTPIQNSMAELWALLHFIMPKLFDSHEQFQEWFSKDIENHSFNNQGEINKHQLRRLHLVLKPFMLRRLKKDVESEIGPKIEFEEHCQMTHRQRVLYHRIKSKISTKDLFQLVESKAKMENLMNLVMQFRKVCNHPELFERRVGRIPLSFKELQIGMLPNPAFQSVPDLRVQVKNPITFEIPQLIFDECYLPTDNQTSLFRKIRSNVDEAFQELSLDTHMNLFNIFSAYNLHQSIFKSNKSSGLSILRLLSISNGWSFGEIAYLFVADPLMKQIALMHYYSQKYHTRIYNNIHNSNMNSLQIKGFYVPEFTKLDICVNTFINRDYSSSLIYRDLKIYSQNGKRPEIIPPLVNEDLNNFVHLSRQLRQDLDIFVQAALAEPINFYCRSGNFNRYITCILKSSLHKKVLLGSKFKPRFEIHLGRIGKDRSSFLEYNQQLRRSTGYLPTGYNLIERGILDETITEKGASILELPNYSRLVTDCAKMQYLDKLLTKISRENHRCLIFCQMTRMLDILEDFLCWRKYTYFRMDGSTSIPDRRYMVEEYQKNPNIFAFLLSTRAGGLGVNLTAADTVIFYDNDWNPTMDAQATDRAHRIGQTKTVSVYRLITQGTVEEKILKRARQKQNVQSTVYGGNALKADVFNARDVVDMILDDQEQNDLKQSGQFLKTKRPKKFKGMPTVATHKPTLHVEPIDDHEMGDETIIDTMVQPQKKSTPAKLPKKQDEAPAPKGKPGRKPNPDKPQRQIQNIFSTVKTSQYDKATPSGPFSIQKAVAPQTSSSPTQQQVVGEDMEYDEGQDEYGEEEEEEVEVQDIFQLLENANIEYNDDENPIPADIEEDEEGGSKFPANQQIINEDEDEEMADEY